LSEEVIEEYWSHKRLAVFSSYIMISRKLMPIYLISRTEEKKTNLR